MDSKAYFEKVMQDLNQFREVRSLRKYCSMALSKLRDNAIECAIRTLTTQRNNMLHFWQ